MERPVKSVAVIQSCYIPWKGFFDIIAQVDEFILFDEVQHTRRDWRNRNMVKTPKGPDWLSIPLLSKGHYDLRIDEIQTDGHQWVRKHLATLNHLYARTPCYRAEKDWLEAAYHSLQTTSLSAINRLLINRICQRLEITTPVTSSSDYSERMTLGATKTDRLVSLCLAAGATHYLSGPSARDYLEVERFEQHGLTVSFVDYSGYPEYDQPYPPFSHNVTILDMIFCLGSQTRRYMKN